jgi:hypothetical protein
MTREEFRAKWSPRRSEWEKLGVVVSGAKMYEEFIADFEGVLTAHDEAVLNTNQASAMTGYSRAQLLRQYLKKPGCGDTRKESTCSSEREICRGSRGAVVPSRRRSRRL